MLSRILKIIEKKDIDQRKIIYLNSIHNSQRRKPHFSLVELLIVVTILIILISMLLPNLSRSIEMSRQVKCAQNQKQLGVGVALYSEDYVYLPVARDNDSNNVGAIGGYLHAIDHLARLNEYLGFPGHHTHNTTEETVTRCPSNIAVDRGYPFYDINWKQHRMTYSFSLHVGYSHKNSSGGYNSPIQNYYAAPVRIEEVPQPHKRGILMDGLNDTAANYYVQKLLRYNYCSIVQNYLVGLHNSGENVLYLDGHSAHQLDITLDASYNSDRETNSIGIFNDVLK